MTITTTFDSLCSQIDSIQPPEPVVPLFGPDEALAATPLPAGVRSTSFPRAVWMVTVPLALLSWATPVTAPLGLIALAVVAVWSVWYTRLWRAEFRRRKAELLAAEQAQLDALSRADAVGPVGFDAARDELRKMQREYTQTLPEREREALDQVDRTAAERQRQRHLQSCTIWRATIPGLGLVRKTTLRQFGIASAADVRADLIERLPGFGPTLTASVLAWRDSCAASFRFDPTDPATARERSEAVQPIEQRRRAIEAALSEGRDELAGISSCPADYAVQVGQELALADRDRAQAYLNLSVM